VKHLIEDFLYPGGGSRRTYSAYMSEGLILKLRMPNSLRLMKKTLTPAGQCGYFTPYETVGEVAAHDGRIRLIVEWERQGPKQFV
jgi:hypothetical protein